MNEQKILSNLIHVALFTNFEVGRKFNAAVVKLALEGENTFDTDLLMEIVTATGFNPVSPAQKEAVNFVIENILAKRNAAKPPYVPSSLGEEWPNWAVDADGRAFYYKDMPKQLNTCWDVNYGAMFKRDEYFIADSYKEMFAGDNWKNTLHTWNGPKNYKPEFTDEYTEWAIDKCGDAYFYEKITECTGYSWHGETMLYDVNFDKAKFPHMWKHNAWKTSNVTKQQ